MEIIHLKLGRVCIGKRKVVCRSVPHSPNFLSNKHWGTKYAWRSAWHEEVWGRWQEVKRLYKNDFPLKKAKLTVLVYCIEPQDEDNFIASLKPVIDGLRHANIIEDDTPKHLKINPHKIIPVNTKEKEHLELIIEPQ